MPTTRHIVALDLGTTTGWATRLHSGAILSGSQAFKADRFSGGGMRYLRFDQWLQRLFVPHPGAVYFEEVRRHAGTTAAHVYGGLLAMLTARCESFDIPYEGVPVGTIKRYATGKGNAGKPAMIEACQRYGRVPVDDNEADALHLLHWAMDQQA